MKVCAAHPNVCRAIQVGGGACAMVPLTKDVRNGDLLLLNITRMYAVTGDKDLAARHLTIMIRSRKRLCETALR